MSLIVENGTGVSGANSFILSSFVTAYLAERSRESEASWDTATTVQQDAACIAATDYIENRYRQLFLGSKLYVDISLARSTLTFAANPLDGETVTIGSQVYTILDTLLAAGDVQRGSSAAETILNLHDAVNANLSTAGTRFHAATVINPDAGAQLHTGDTMLAYGKLTGTADNAVATTTTVTGGSWNFATLHGGTDIRVAQPLSFPRFGLFDRDGIVIVGMPLRLMYATAEYAVRAHASALAPDPDVDALGGTVTSLREKVGPIETETEYLPGTANSGALPAYPAADRLLAEYIATAGRVIRG